MSRGEIFQTRMFSLIQKRMFVSFLEWCAAVTASATTDSASPESQRLDLSSLDPEDAGSFTLTQFESLRTANCQLLSLSSFQLTSIDR